MSEAKPFTIERQLVMDAWLRVKANKGSAGIDEMSVEEFDKGYKTYLYKLWNRMSSGSYMPPPVMLVEIPKKDGGKRPLGIPTIADRIAQTVVAGLLEKELEPLFHEDSFGYRPGRSAHQAIQKCLERCRKYGWVVDLDIKGFFENIPHDLLMKSVEKHTACKWVLLYIKRWLTAPLQKGDGTIHPRTVGIPQGSAIGPILANLYLHYCLDLWLKRGHPFCKFERYADDVILHVRSEGHAIYMKKHVSERLKSCGLEMHAEKSKIVYCKDSNRPEEYHNVQFDFLGYTFKPREAQNSIRKETFTNWLPAVSQKSMRSMRDKMKEWKTLKTGFCEIEDVAREINLVVQGWFKYYGRFYQTKLKSFMHAVNLKIAKWARSKYKKVRPSVLKAARWLKGLSLRSPNLFTHWTYGVLPTFG